MASFIHFKCSNCRLSMFVRLKFQDKHNFTLVCFVYSSAFPWTNCNPVICDTTWLGMSLEVFSTYPFWWREKHRIVFLPLAIAFYRFSSNQADLVFYLVAVNLKSHFQAGPLIFGIVVTRHGRTGASDTIYVICKPNCDSVNAAGSNLFI